MDWIKEWEARLAEDRRLERKTSRRHDVSGGAYAFHGKEILRLGQGRFSLRLTREGILLLGPLVGDGRLQNVSHDWVEVVVGAQEDLAFAAQLLERALREHKNNRPRGRGLPSAKKRKPKSIAP